jgi:hypothetical protein
MLSGKRLFSEETVSDVLAAVLKSEPDWAALPAEVPEPLRALLHSCLAKSPVERLRDIGDARLFMDSRLEVLTDGAAAPAPPARRLHPRPLFLGMLLGGALSALLLMTFFQHSGEPTAAIPTRLTVNLPEDALFGVQSYPGHSLAISRDGRVIVYSPWGDGPLHIRDLAELTTRPLEGTA